MSYKGGVAPQGVESVLPKLVVVFPFFCVPIAPLLTRARRVLEVEKISSPVRTCEYFSRYEQIGELESGLLSAVVSVGKIRISKLEC